MESNDRGRRWRRAVPALAVAVACFVLTTVQATAFGAEASSSGSLAGPLVLTGSAETLFPGNALLAEEALRSTPEAQQARVASEQEWSGLGPEAAASLAAKEFPLVVQRPDGGLQLPEGDRVTQYLDAHAARISLPTGAAAGAAVVESLAPIATPASGGTEEWAPVDLGLQEAGEAFAPKNAPAAVRLPKSLAEGVSLPETGVSLTPLAESGEAAGSAAGSIEGSAVFWGGASMGQDVDVLAKPSGDGGFDVLAVLRSQASPEALRFRVGMPEGASLVQEASGGAVQVRDVGRTLAWIMPPSVRDAAGSRVTGVSMSVSGDVVSVNVPHPAGMWLYPLMVDPTVVDVETKLESAGGNWAFGSTNPAGAFSNEKGLWGMFERNPSGKKYVAGEYGLFGYETQGESRIYEMEATSTNHNDSTVSSVEYIGSAGAGVESGGGVPQAAGSGPVCVATGCAAVMGTSVNWGNGVFYKQAAITEGSYAFEDGLSFASVYIIQEKGPSANLEKNNEKIFLNGAPSENALYGKRWANNSREVAWIVALHATDPGIGVRSYQFSSPQEIEWERNKEKEFLCTGLQCGECDGVECTGGFPVYADLHGLPDGEDTVKATVKNALGQSATTEGVVKIDKTPPHEITITGLPEKWEVGDGIYGYTLKATASDVNGTLPVSGIASLAFSFDGKTIAKSGSCAPTLCVKWGFETAWTLNGWEYSAGPHTLTVTATDNAGNVETYSRTVTIRHAAPVSVGPGSVNPVSGELTLGATDVSLPGGSGASLSFSRTYRSRYLEAGVEGPLGPQWALSLDQQPTLTSAYGGMELASPGGGRSLFTSNSKGEYASPAGDASVTLRQTKSEPRTFVLEDANAKSSTTFTLPAGESWKSEGAVMMPSATEGRVLSEDLQYSFETLEGTKLMRPVEVLGPVPAGVTCTLKKKQLEEIKLNVGCTALTFNYATATTAKGEAPAEWGDYERDLTRVYYTASNGSTVEVAHYLYDSKGRLRAEWDPRITPALKTTYGYDSESHVVGVSPHGLQPWLIHYGTSAKDLGAGRVLSVIRPAAEITFGHGLAPVNTAAPTLSTSSPVVGQEIKVTSHGTWSNSPLTYGFQWQRCEATGGKCAPITGATNAGYYPVVADEGHALKALVTAINASGTASVASTATSAVAAGTPSEAAPTPPSAEGNSIWTVDYTVPVSGKGAPYTLGTKETEAWAQKDNPVEAAAVFPPDEPMGWPAKNYEKATVYYLDAKERAVNVATPGGAIATSEYNEANDVVRSLSADNRAAALKEGAGSAAASQKLDTQSTYNSEGSELLSTLGPEHAIKLANGKEAQARSHTVYHYNEGAPSSGGPYQLVTKVTQGAQIEGQGEQEINTTVKSYAGQNNLGWTLRSPTSVTVDPGSLHLVTSTIYEPTTGNVLETKPPAAYSGPTYASQFGTEGTGNGQLKHPEGIAINSSGDIWVVDTGNNRVQEFGPKGEYLRQFGTKGKGNGEFSSPAGIAIDGKGNLWVADAGNERVQEFSSTGSYISQFKVTGSLPYGIKIDKSEHIWVTTELPSYLEEFTTTGEQLKKIGSEGKGNGQFNGPWGIAFDSAGHVWIADTYNSRVQEFSAAGEYMAQYPVERPKELAFNSSGNLWITVPGGIEEMSPSGSVLTTFGTEGTGNGEFKRAAGIAIESSGNLQIADQNNNRVQKITPATTQKQANSTQTIYYSKEANSKYSECGGHAEWANLPCRTQPAEQPKTEGLPSLPESTITYNMYLEPETTTSTAGTSTRKSIIHYDSAGRKSSSETTSNSGKALPVLSYKYSEQTGALIEETGTLESKSQSIKDAFNTVGQLTSYTDANGATTTYEYESGIDARLQTLIEPKGVQTYHYDPTTSAITELTDSSAGTLIKVEATYDVEGKMLSETYPNKMSADFGYDPVGEEVSVSYVKEANCASTCPETWFSDSAVPTAHGQWASQKSSLSSENYSYDAFGRLTQTQEEPAGEGCTTRLYAYDSETNRLSLTTRPPGTGGACATEGGTIQSHTYDAANRLMDSGMSYGAFGEISKLPAADAGGSILESQFFADGQLAEQTQAGQTIGYQLDPSGRTQQITDTGNVNSSTIDHYAGPGETPAWTEEPANGHLTRNIEGIGGLVAIRESSGETVLQIEDLQGNIVATASTSETATKPLSTERSTEYGVPTTTKPKRYGWLGGNLTATELSAGATAMGTRSYIPQLGRYLQTDPVPGGSANQYAYTYGNPVNETDPTGEYGGNGLSSWAIGLAGQITNEEVTAYAAAQALAREEAERKAREAEGASQETSAPTEGGVEEAVEVEEGEEEANGGDPVAVAATRANTPEARFAEAQCDKERDRLEKLGHEVGDFTGKYQTEPGKRYKGTNYELLYETKLPPFIPFSSGGGELRRESTCQVIIDRVHGHYHVTHGPHFRLGQGLRSQYFA